MAVLIKDIESIEKIDGKYQYLGESYTYAKVCVNPRCKQPYLTNSRSQRYCTPECNKKHVKDKKSRRYNYTKEYKHLQSLVSASYSVTHRLALLFFPVLECQCCHSQEDIEIHHADVNPFNNSPYNLLPLCKKCHSKLHTLIPAVNIMDLLKELDQNINRPLQVDPMQLYQKYFTPQQLNMILFITNEFLLNNQS